VEKLKVMKTAKNGEKESKTAKTGAIVLLSDIHVLLKVRKGQK